MQPSTWRRSSNDSTLTMYLGSRMHMQALASLAASLAFSARITEKLLVHNHDLYCLKFAIQDSRTPRGDLQVKEILETSTVQEPRD